MIFLTGDVVAVLGFGLMVASAISVIITWGLKLIYKDRLKIYQYFLISVVLIVVMLLIFINNPGFFLS
ncbi:hypothetical protein Q766_10110 [Flavobacterium subsaxonicum WB 4.1-42 = DSM 21790]|uniref:Uncharacterized protein n=1 Tax=Flavobacterium subsaxonicum WB 4.1-42 = DSM 21790 TaxID=1121898 RepID=A0A0A2MXL7_9FLAO|nr:hypothetical protein Q766_10110 [Flavobacterium subsaxonicum WB 4.1-42 = DSM 21790]